MCKHYITKLKRECKLKGKYDGYCGKHKKSSMENTKKVLSRVENVMSPKKVVKRKLGKAGSRSKKQEKWVREECYTLLDSFDSGDIICFTDGACRGNPGPCGAGCVVSFNGNKYEDGETLGYHTNNIGELWAIWLALKTTSQNITPEFRDSNIRIISDSQYTIGVLSKGWKAKKNVELIGWIKNLISKTHNNVSFHWVGAHSGVPNNEKADQLASDAGKKVRQGVKYVDIKKQPFDLFSIQKTTNKY